MNKMFNILKRFAVYHKNINGKQKISFTSKHEEEKSNMMEQDYLQICDRTKLTDNRSLEKKQEERNNLLRELEKNQE